MKFKINDRVVSKVSLYGRGGRGNLIPGIQGIVVDFKSSVYGRKTFRTVQVLFDGHDTRIWMEEEDVKPFKESKPEPAKSKTVKEPLSCPKCGTATEITPFRSIAWSDAPSFYRMTCKCGWYGPPRRSKKECLYRDYVLQGHGPFGTKSKTGPTGLEMVEKIIEYHQPRLPEGHKCAHCSVRLAEASQKSKGASKDAKQPKYVPHSVGRLKGNGDPVWHSRNHDSQGNPTQLIYWCGNWAERTSAELMAECRSIIADLVIKHPELTQS